MDFEVDEVEGGYNLEWFSRNTSHHGDSWYEIIEDALEQASTEFDVRHEGFLYPIRHTSGRGLWRVERESGRRPLGQKTRHANMVPRLR